MFVEKNFYRRYVCVVGVRRDLVWKPENPVTPDVFYGVYKKNNKQLKGPVCKIYFLE